MQKRITQIAKYTIYILATNAIYGLILYFTCTWLARYSLQLAFLGNILLILAGLALDEYSLRMLRSEQLFDEMKKQRDQGKGDRYIQLILDNFVSFKAVLYLFYMLILIVSEIFELEQTLVGINLVNFITVTKYSILLLVAFDMLIAQFTKDRQRVRTIAADYRKHIGGSQDSPG